MALRWGRQHLDSGRVAGLVDPTDMVWGRGVGLPADGVRSVLVAERHVVRGLDQGQPV